MKFPEDMPTLGAGSGRWKKILDALSSRHLPDINRPESLSRGNPPPRTGIDGPWTDPPQPPNLRRPRPSGSYG